MFSEQGQLLDLPDRNYYSEEPPYVNEAMLRGEVDEAKRLVDAVVKLGFNAITFLHVSFEDYIDYEDLEGPIYPSDDRHRVRSPVFCRYLSELCDYAHARHVEFYLQTYEIQYPSEVDRLYGVRLDSPNLPKVLAARCRELFRRVPLDGLVITPNETHPRCGYRSQQLWQSQGRAGAGRMCQLYDEACRTLGKRAIFRLWRVADNAAAASGGDRPGSGPCHAGNQGHRLRLLSELPYDGHPHQSPGARTRLDGHLRHLPPIRRLGPLLLPGTGLGPAGAGLPRRRCAGDRCLGILVAGLYLSRLGPGLSADAGRLAAVGRFRAGLGWLLECLSHVHAGLHSRPGQRLSSGSLDLGAGCRRG